MRTKNPIKGGQRVGNGAPVGSEDGPALSWQDVAIEWARRSGECLDVRRVTQIGEGAMRKLIRRMIPKEQR